MAEGDAKPASTTAAPSRFGEGFLRDIWGEPVLLGRTRGGVVYAMRDVCPHRAAPLSAGRLVSGEGGAELVECPYHGWLWRTDGACAAIPSLVGDQAMDVGRIR